MNATQISTEGSGTCMVGALETWPLADVILWLHQSRRTAMLRVGVGLEAGVLFLRNGFLYRAEWGRLQGTEALFELLGQGSGTFALIQRDVPAPRPNIHVPTNELLLQLAVARDERRRALSA